MIGKKQHCLVLKWTELPQQFKDEFKDSCGFHNDCYIEYFSECGPQEGETWGAALKTAIAESWELEAFDEWLIAEGYDLSDVDEILIKICW